MGIRKNIVQIPIGKCVKQPVYSVYTNDLKINNGCKTTILERSKINQKVYLDNTVGNPYHLSLPKVINMNKSKSLKAM